MQTYRPQPRTYLRHQEDPQDLTEDHKKNVTLAAITLEGRKLVTTATGFVGLAPEAAQKNDVVAVLFGCSFPVVLRPFERSFKYIGECYVDGLMRGEAIGAMERGEYRAVDITLV
jgi:hypothetical protein